MPAKILTLSLLCCTTLVACEKKEESAAVQDANTPVAAEAAAPGAAGAAAGQPVVAAPVGQPTEAGQAADSNTTDMAKKGQMEREKIQSELNQKFTALSESLQAAQHKMAGKAGKVNAQMKVKIATATAHLKALEHGIKGLTDTTEGNFSEAKVHVEKALDALKGEVDGLSAPAHKGKKK
jgi:hypothetical protein